MTAPSIPRPRRRRRIAAAVAAILLGAGLGLRLLLGDPNPPRIFVYDGYGTAARFQLRGRILERREERPGDPQRSPWANLLDQWRTLETDELAGVKLRLSALGGDWDVVTDEEGYFDVAGSCARGCPGPGPVPVQARILAPGRWATERDAGIVHLVADEGGVGLLSDIDDTIVESHVTAMGRMVEQAALKNAAQLQPVAGVGESYRAGVAAGARIVVYLSGSPTSFDSRIHEFMARHGLPRGPLLLKDFGRDPLFAQEEYKPRKIAAVFAALPKLRFVLIGDSGERDPEIYRAVAQAHPERVAGIVIRLAPGANQDPARFTGMHLLPDFAAVPGVVAELVRAGARAPLGPSR